jgi:hypothetical protein
MWMSSKEYEKLKEYAEKQEVSMAEVLRVSRHDGLKPVNSFNIGGDQSPWLSFSP